MLALSRLSLLALFAAACGTSQPADLARTAPSPSTRVTAGSTADGCDDDDRHYRDGIRLCETRTLALSGSRLVLNASPNGGIEVEPWDRDGIEVTAVVEAWAETENDARRLLGETEVRVDGQSVRTRLPERDRDEKGWASVSYEVRVPRDADLDLSTVNGGISVAGVTGSLSLNSVNGGLALARVGGAIDGETVNGPVTVELNDAPSRGLRLETTNGPVTLVVPEGLSAEVDAETNMGPVRIDGLPLEDEACEDRDTRYSPCMSGRVIGTLGRGGPALRLRTTNGPISLKRR